MNAPDDLTPEQMEQISNLVFTLYRYDFRQYAKASLKRRLLRIMSRFNINFEGFIHNLKTKPTFIHQFITELTVNVTEMFRDPFVYRAIREKFIPLLQQKESIGIWHAGCSSGEEVLSMAILLHNEGLLEKSELLGTDLNPLVLQEAQKGIIPHKGMEENESRYQEVYPEKSLTSFFESQYGNATVSRDMLQHIHYELHNLVNGQSPGKFDLIVCRNVYIYFELGLQEKVLQLLYRSLKPHGLLCMGSKETIRFADHASKFEVIDPEARLYQRID